MKILVKTRRGFERIVATHIIDLFGEIPIRPAPWGSQGIVLVEGLGESDAERILKEIPEVEKALPILCECKASLEELAECAKEVAHRIRVDETFAVRTTRRGKHDFTSLDVNSVVGAVVKEETAARVNLDNPEKVIWVEIFNDKAFLSVSKEQVIGKKYDPSLIELLSKISFAQMPYLEDRESAYRMGVRIGRAAQTFEIGELVVAPIEPADIVEFKSFLDGLLEGRKSRYEIQRKSYSRKPRLVPIRIFDLYRLARARFGEVFVSTSTRGEPLTHEKCKELIDLIEKSKRVTILAGSREGLPTGIFRWSKITINLAPGITFATEHTIPTTITAIITCYQVAKEKNK